MFRNRTKRFWIILIVVVAACVFYLPSLVAFHYTAATQRTGFLIRPWRSWSFAWAALTVSADSKLKTSGEALRAADAMFAGSQVDPHAVRLLFLAEGDPYTFTHEAAGNRVSTTITPPGRFVWQTTGSIDTGAGSHPDTVVALLDYESGKVLYDVRSDLTTTPPPTPSPAASPAGSPAPSGSPSP